MSRRQWLLRISGTLLFLSLLAVLVWRGALQPEELARTLISADPWLIGLSLVLYWPFLLAKAERWRRLAAGMGMSIGLSEAQRLYAVGLGAGALTPGQSGDFVKAWALRRRGHPLADAVWSSALDRLFDLIGLALLALLGVWVFGREFVGEIGVIAILGLGALAAAGLIARRDLLIRFLPMLEPLFGRSRTGWSLGPAALAGAVLLTVAGFGVATLRVWLLALSVGDPLGFVQVAGLAGLTTVAALLPVSIAGLGTRDAAMVVLFARLGRGPAEALALSTLILGLTLAQALVGYLVWVVDTRYLTARAGSGEAAGG